LFGVLVHQGHEGAADWDDILRLYADRARLFVIHNPQWTGSDESIRLSEFAQEEYREKVPGTKGKSLQEMKPVPARSGGGHLRLPWEIGITDADLMEKMKELGFKLQYFENTGQFREGFENFENHAFIFSKE
jgi:hypothetical protein